MTVVPGNLTDGARQSVSGTTVRFRRERRSSSSEYAIKNEIPTKKTLNFVGMCDMLPL